MISLALLLPLFAAPAVAPAGDEVAVKAGTIHLVENDVVLKDGTILIRDGKIVAVGLDVNIPGSARVVDYGPDAVIVPGFVAADSNLGAQMPSQRTASPGLRAIENFDTYGAYDLTLSSGVTTVYMAPARNRLIAGQGAVVKLGGEAGPSRVLSKSALIHGAISAEARRTPGYWEPPVPATVDVGMGVAEAQLPRTTMGAVLALTELLELADGGDSELYGAFAGPELSALLKSNRPWRMAAVEENEILALLSFFSEHKLPLVIDVATNAAGVAEQIAASGVPVIVDISMNPEGGGRDFGKGEDAQWPDHTLASKLAAAGCRIAITQPNRVSPMHLKFAAGLALRGGLSMEAALRAITLTPAEIMGVDSRVGSIAAGKDADLVVMNGAPLDMTTSVVSTWVGGEIAWKGEEGAAVVLRVKELHVGDGEVIADAEILLENGKIVEVGHRVSRPYGAAVVTGFAAMPGMIDAFGHLGLEGSGRTPKTGFKLSRLVEPGDFADRRVARAGVTTVMLAPRNASNSGAAIMAYKPAGDDVDSMVVADPGAVRVTWTSRNRTLSGKSVKALLESAAKYKAGWDKYEADMAKYTPPAEEDDEEATEEEDEESDEDESKDADKDDDKKKKKKKKKGKKKKKEEEKPVPVTGVWECQIDWPTLSESSRLFMRLNDIDGTLTGVLRCDAISTELVTLTGMRKERESTLTGLGTGGTVTVTAKTEKGKFVGKLILGLTEVEFTAEQKSKDYVVVGRPEVRAEKKEEPKKAPKGAPKKPRRNADLEPILAALEGRVSIIVSVERDDEILECVEAFKQHGVKPVLFGARDAYKVASEIRDHIRGVLLSHQVLFTEAKTGTKKRNRYAELAGQGIRVAFHSGAEEGAMELPLMAAYAVSQGMSPTVAMRALTSDAAGMFGIEDRVGRLRQGLDADVLLLDGSPLDVSTSVLRVWVAGTEIR